MAIKENYEKIKSEVEALRPDHPPRIISVSKYQPLEKVEEALAAGIVHFGENRIVEGFEKFHGIGRASIDFVLHHIGPVQTGTIRKYNGLYSYAHGVGSASVLDELKKRLDKDRWKMKVFLQVNLTDEDSKSGFSREEIKSLLRRASSISTEYCTLEGLMTMGPSSGDPVLTRKVFKELHSLRMEYAPNAKLSMGMSGDYRIAVEEGSDYLRIGTSIFGERK
ncbi:YggS family pyridoxal phosphate-dependent enzyme [Leptospira perolatii]|uniref:Pyridoxal phosphate homeostasis protein n=1 Tax=Leptospira perolatii TaxID=2023191 RepID=A0A2M9ZLD9_9LEPT|nr:YggS family pyridoxal phosphate-dependent enzyme [Leptospira perolatii]PJZ70325.1 YggS family pyridoxal phosphate-dependent enzyme [Leptospira perolatii]PJZ72791.1 YggS family pyridoxal phosphate-dependent enzyme [Leptospira perolatii]